ncbi:MAG TPA: DUF2062 domain-containing protein [archaeon]|nr:DUF2062 domain-containing protein [archaeon]
MDNYYRKYKDKGNEYLQLLLKSKTSPHSVALGFAIGTFISVLPTPGLHFVLGFLILLLVKKISKYSLFFTLLFWNALTLTPIWMMSYKIGDWIFGSEAVVRYKFELLNQAYNFSRRFLVGNVILAILISVILYFATKQIVRWYYLRRLLREINKRPEEAILEDITPWEKRPKKHSAAREPVLATQPEKPPP